MSSNTESRMNIVYFFGMMSTMVFGCKEPLDLVFLVDGSKGVKPSDFIQEKAFISSQTMEYFVSPDRVNIAVMLYSDKVYEVIDFKISENEDNFVNRVSAMIQPYGDIVISEGLKSAQEQFESKGRPGVKQSVVVIASGRTSRLWESFREARRLRQGHAALYAIGVGGDVSENELMGLTSDRNNVLLVDTFNLMFSLSSTLHELICPDYQQRYPPVTIHDSSSLLKPQIEVSIINNLNNGGLFPLLPQRYNLIEDSASNNHRNPMLVAKTKSVEINNNFSKNISLRNDKFNLPNELRKTSNIRMPNVQNSTNKNRTVMNGVLTDLDVQRSQIVDTDNDDDNINYTKSIKLEQNSFKMPITHKLAWKDIVSGLAVRPKIKNFPNKKESSKSIERVIRYDVNPQIKGQDKKEKTDSKPSFENTNKSRYPVKSELPEQKEKVSTMWDTILANMDLHSVVHGQIEIPQNDNVQPSVSIDASNNPPKPPPIHVTSSPSLALDHIVVGDSNQRNMKRNGYVFDKRENVNKNDYNIHVQLISNSRSASTDDNDWGHSTVSSSTVLPLFVVTSTQKVAVRPLSTSTQPSKVSYPLQTTTDKTSTTTERSIITTTKLLTTSNSLFKTTQLTTKPTISSIKRLKLTKTKNEIANYLNSVDKKEFRSKDKTNLLSKKVTKSRKGRPININLNEISNSNRLTSFGRPMDIRQEITSILDYLIQQQDRRKRKRKRKKIKTTTTAKPETTPLVLWKDVDIAEKQDDKVTAQGKRYIDMTRFGKRNIPNDWNFRRSAKFLPGNEIRRKFLTPKAQLTVKDKQDNNYCHLVPYKNDASFYLDHSDNRTVIRPCPEGTAFDLRSCACTIMTTFRGISGCNPEILLDFKTDVHDKSGKNIHVGSHFVDLSNGSAVFHGDSDLTIWRFTGSHIGQKFMIKARFKTKKSPEVRQYLISNCQKDLPLISYGIEIDRYEEVVIFSLDTQPRELQIIKIPFKLDQWTTVALMYDGLKLTGMVDDKVKVVPLAGNVETRSSPLRIGGCGGKNKGFTGLIDEISLSMCIPKRNRRRLFG